MFQRIQFFFTSFLLLLFSGVFFAFAPIAQAATTVTNAYAQPTNLVSSEASNHKFVFTTPGGVAEGETIVLTFGTDFDTSSIVEDDIDLDDDGGDLTTAADCAGSEQASVAIASDVLTITICAGDGGAIAATSVVTIEIGTNASASGTGSNQVTNPTANATYVIDISGTFGETGAIWIPILSDDDAGVTATVPSSGGGGGGSGSGGGGHVSASIDITSPNGAEEIDANSEFKVEWTMSGTVGYVNIYYSTDNGLTYTNIAMAERNNGSYFWSVPDVSTEEALIQIELTDLATISDTDFSDAVFSIVQAEEGVEEVEDPVEEETDSADTEEVDVPTVEDDIEIPTDEETNMEDSVPEEKTEDSEEEMSEAPVVIIEKSPKVEGAVPEEAEAFVEDSVLIEETEDEVVADRRVDTGFTTLDGSIDLEPDGRTVEAFANTQTRVTVLLDDPDEVDSARIIVGDETYPLSQLSDGSFTSVLPVGASKEALTVIADYFDGATVTDTYHLVPSPYGFVFELIEGKTHPVPDGSALVYRVVDGALIQWNAGVYGQRNPVIVGENGVIGWYVPNGEYVVVVQKDGYADSRVEVSVRNNLLAPSIELVPEELCQDILSLGCLRNDARIQLSAKIAKIVSVLTVIGGTVILASSFNLWNFLRFLFTQPFLLFARRKRKNFGVVYNAATKAPIDLAIVRLYNASGKLVRTIVTDNEGRYFFKMDPGRYSMKVIKSGYIFPSEFVLGKKQDGPYLDVYTKGSIEVTAADTVIAANIPMDPEQEWSHHSPKAVILRRFLRVFQHIIAVSGVILSLAIVIFFPSILNVVLLIVQVILYLLTLRVARPKKPTGWGIVRDKVSNKPLANAVVRLFEPKFNKLIETTVTDRQGRYAFMVGQSKYFVTYEKPGYKKQEVKPIDYTKKAELTPIAVDINLSKNI